LSLSVNQNLPTKAASDNHHLTRPPLLILIDAPFPSRLSRYSEELNTMSQNSNPIGLYGRLNCGVLLAITPEYNKIKSARQSDAGRPVARSVPFSIKPEYKKIAGVNVRCASAGKLNGPTVLLLNPLPQSILAFDPIWDQLGEQFRLIALDLPGFGRSEGGLEFMTFKAQGDFLNAFVDELDLSDIHIIGPDIGMAAALHYVIHSTHKAASLMIGDGPGIAPSYNGSVINKMVDSAFWRIVFRIAGAEAFVAAGNALCYLNYAPSYDEVADYVASYAGRIGPVTEWFAKYPESLATVDPYLADIDLPVKVFWGDLDQLLFVDNGERLHKRLKRSDFTVFQHCGHFSYQDKADEFVEMVTDWINTGHKSL
jgi:pimeloyl-ACP methyl ester carboxylesterase